MGTETETSNRSQHEKSTGASRQHFTKNKPAKTKVSRKIQKRKHAKMQVILNNPLTNNVYTCLKKNRSTSCPIPTKKKKYKKNNLISQMYHTIGKREQKAGMKQPQK